MPSFSEAPGDLAAACRRYNGATSGYPTVEKEKIVGYSIPARFGARQNPIIRSMRAYSSGLWCF